MPNEKHYTNLVLDQYQEFFKAKILANDKFGVFMPQGMGKTLTILESLRTLFEKGKMGKVLIIAPVICLRNVWVKEIETWGYPFSVYVCHGNNMKCKVTKNHDIYLISSDAVRSAQTVLLLKTVKPSICIVDESSKFRNHSSNRTKRIIKLLYRIVYKRKQSLSVDRISCRFDRVYLLSGTPMPNHIQNLWSQIFLLDGGKRLGACITHFRDQFCLPYDPNKFGYLPKPGIEGVIYDKITDISASIAPEYTAQIKYNDIEFDLADTALRQYKRLERASILELDSGKKIAALNIAVKVAKLRQLSGGAFYDEDKNVEVISSDKIAQFRDFLQLQQGNTVLVGYNYTHEATRMIAVLKKSGLSHRWIHGGMGAAKVTQIINDWNDKKVSVLIGHPAAMAHGLNLQHGGSTILWFSAPNGGDFELYDQFNARLNRKGQTQQVIVHHLVANRTYDKKSFLNINRKMSEHEAFMGYIQQEDDHEKAVRNINT